MSAFNLKEESSPGHIGRCFVIICLSLITTEVVKTAGGPANNAIFSQNSKVKNFNWNGIPTCNVQNSFALSYSTKFVYNLKLAPFSRLPKKADDY